MKVTTSIHFNHELDLLEAQIVEASHYSDRIVVKEGERNWRGEEKPLHATENWDRFRKYSKAEVMVIPADEFVRNPQDKKEMCLNETKTRTYGWQNVSDSVDYVNECDVDEIIDRRKFHILEPLMEEGYLHITMKYQNHLWYMNNRLKWHTPYRVFKTGEPEINLTLKGRKRIGCGQAMGWHFSGCIDGENWTKKYTDMHLIYGYSAEEIGSIDFDRFREQKIKVDRNRNEVPLEGDILTKINLDHYPLFVQQHPEQFPWWGDPVFINGR
jgi:hypothetical protein